MEITVTDAGEVKVVRIEGKLDTQTSADAQAQLTQLIDQGATKLVVNFEKLDYISSAGLRVFLLAAKRMGNANGRMILCSLKDAVKQVFDIAGFSSFLTLAGSTEEAINNI